MITSNTIIFGEVEGEGDMPKESDNHSAADFADARARLGPRRLWKEVWTGIRKSAQPGPEPGAMGTAASQAMLRARRARSEAQSDRGSRSAMGEPGAVEWDYKRYDQGESAMRGVSGRAAAATAALSRLDGADVACAHDGEDEEEVGEQDGGAGRVGAREWDYDAQTLTAELRETKLLVTRMMESTEKRLEAGAAARRRMELEHRASMATVFMTCEMRLKVCQEGGNLEAASRDAATAWCEFAAVMHALSQAGLEEAGAWRAAAAAEVEAGWGWPAGTCARWEGGEGGELAGAAAVRMQAAARLLLARRRAARRRVQLLVTKRAFAAARLAAREAEEREKKARRPGACTGRVSAAALAACSAAAVAAAAERRLAVARGLQVREAEVRERRRQREAGKEAWAVRAAADALAREAQALEAEDEPDWLREAGVALSWGAADEDVPALSEVDVASVAEAVEVSRVMARSVAQAKREERMRVKAVAGESRAIARAESRSLAEALVGEPAEVATSKRRVEAGARRLKASAARRESGARSV